MKSGVRRIPQFALRAALKRAHQRPLARAANDFSGTADSRNAADGPEPAFIA